MTDRFAILLTIHFRDGSVRRMYIRDPSTQPTKFELVESPTECEWLSCARFARRIVEGVGLQKPILENLLRRQGLDVDYVRVGVQVAEESLA